MDVIVVEVEESAQGAVLVEGGEHGRAVFGLKPRGQQDVGEPEEDNGKNGQSQREGGRPGESVAAGVRSGVFWVWGGRRFHGVGGARAWTSGHDIPRSMLGQGKEEETKRKRRT